MKLYYAPGACSLADHIALEEGGLTFDIVRVDIPTKKTEDGQDFLAISPKGYVPAMVLDGGETISENIAILSWISEQAPALVPAGPLGRTRLLEALAYISTEIHKGFKPFFIPGTTEEDKQAARGVIAARLGYLAGTMQGDFLFGDDFSAADAYFFVMLLWSGRQGVAIPEPLNGYQRRIMARPAVVSAMKREGLI